MYHAGKYEWDCVLDLYAAVIKAIECGEKAWDETFQDVEHMTLSLRPTSRIVENKQKVWGSNDQKYHGNSKAQKVMFCAPYQSGDCKEGDVHRHICAKCWLNDKELRSHGENSACCPQLSSQK